MSAGATAVYAAPEMLLKLRGRFKDRPDRGENSSDSTRDMSDSGRVVAGNFDELSKLDVLPTRLCVRPSFRSGATRTIFMLRMPDLPKRGKRTSRMLSETKGCGPRSPPPYRRNCGRSWSGAGRRSSPDRPAFREIARRLKAVAVRHGTIVPTTSSKLPLGPGGARARRRRRPSFSDEREDPRASPSTKNTARAPAHTHHGGPLSVS